MAGQVRNVVSEIVGMDNLVDAAYPEGQIVLNNPSQRSTVAFSVFGSSRSAKIYAPVVSGSRAHTNTPPPSSSNVADLEDTPLMQAGLTSQSAALRSVMEPMTDLVFGKLRFHQEARLQPAFSAH